MPRKTPRVSEAAVPAEDLKQAFPPIKLPVRPPYPPMEAKNVKEIPSGDGWIYEPKCLGISYVPSSNIAKSLYINILRAISRTVILYC